MNMLASTHPYYIKAERRDELFSRMEPRESDVPYFLGLVLKEGYLDGIEGTYHTPKGYFVAEEDPDGFAHFDASFPYKEKLVLPGQLF